MQSKALRALPLCIILFLLTLHWQDRRELMTEYQPIKEGKVREIYDIGDYLILVATDRISCFDVILHNIVKGKCLTT